ncbi:MAG: hypothetical protein ACR2GZ_10920 [Solirubrobacteraceae bacterium]
MRRLLGSTFRPVLSAHRPLAKHKQLRLTTKAQAAIRANRMRASSSDDRLRECDRFRLARQWTGAVLSVKATTFNGVGITTDSRGRDEQQELSIPLSLVRPADKELVDEGALFYFCIGDFIRSGKSTAGSLVWFRRRLPARTSDDELMDVASAHLAAISWIS